MRIILPTLSRRAMLAAPAALACKAALQPRRELFLPSPARGTAVDEDVSTTQNVIFMPNVLRNREVAYFWLPAALESISVGEIAKLVLFNLRTAAQDW